MLSEKEKLIARMRAMKMDGLNDSYERENKAIDACIKMIEEPDLVIITESECIRLENSEDFLNCLQAAGVDNWDGYEYAQEMMEE